VCGVELALLVLGKQGHRVQTLGVVIILRRMQGRHECMIRGLEVPGSERFLIRPQQIGVEIPNRVRRSHEA
jgi:hypothetical protein